MEPLDPMDPMDPRIAGWWQILDWQVHNDNLEAPTFPEQGLVKGRALAIMKAGQVFNCFWSNDQQQPCSLHYPDVSMAPVTFAEVRFDCEIQRRQLEPSPLDPRWLQLTVTLFSGGVGAGTGNTGTFIAQSVTEPPPWGEPGPGEPGH